MPKPNQNKLELTRYSALKALAQQGKSETTLKGLAISQVNDDYYHGAGNDDRMSDKLVPIHELSEQIADVDFTFPSDHLPEDIYEIIVSKAKEHGYSEKQLGRIIALLERTMYSKKNSYREQGKKFPDEKVSGERVRQVHDEQFKPFVRRILETLL